MSNKNVNFNDIFPANNQQQQLLTVENSQLQGINNQSMPTPNFNDIFATTNNQQQVIPFSQKQILTKEQFLLNKLKEKFTSIDLNFPNPQVVSVPGVPAGVSINLDQTKKSFFVLSNGNVTPLTYEQFAQRVFSNEGVESIYQEYDNYIKSNLSNNVPSANNMFSDLASNQTKDQVADDDQQPTENKSKRGRKKKSDDAEEALEKLETLVKGGEQIAAATFPEATIQVKTEAATEIAFRIAHTVKDLFQLIETFKKHHQ